MTEDVTTHGEIHTLLARCTVHRGLLVGDLCQCGRKHGWAWREHGPWCPSYGQPVPPGQPLPRVPGWG